MPPLTALDEDSLQAEDARLPDLAARAGHAAYLRALKAFGQVIEAVDGQLVETSSDGSRRVIRALKPAMKVPCGLTLVRRQHR
jgi:hypothetical protein